MKICNVLWNVFLLYGPLQFLRCTCNWYISFFQYSKISRTFWISFFRKIFISRCTNKKFLLLFKVDYLQCHVHMFYIAFPKFSAGFIESFKAYEHALLYIHDLLVAIFLELNILGWIFSMISSSISGARLFIFSNSSDGATFRRSGTYAENVH